MFTSPRYLRRDVRIEPLVRQWYAWPQLIPPLLAAMHLANSHVPIMTSYVRDPQWHLDAALRKTLDLGAPVMTYDRLRVDEVRALLDNTLSTSIHIQQLATAVKALAEMLRRKGCGGSLEPLYPLLPDCLRGYVELVYNTENNPSMRFFEGLLYKSKFHDPSQQGFAFSVASDHTRPSVLNTPRLAGPGTVLTNMPFSNAAVDVLFETMRTPRSFDQIADQFNITDLDCETFASFFTEAPPRVLDAYRGPGMRMRYFGHASVLVEWRGASVLIDPMINHEYGRERRWFSFSDLPDAIDYALITHGHEDHLHLETLLAIRHRVRTIVVPKNGGALYDPSLRLLLHAIGFQNVIEVEELDAIECAGGRIVPVPFLGEHGDLDIKAKAAYVVEHSGTRALFVADSNNLEPRVYDLVREAIGDVQVFFVGMECDGSPLTSLYGALLTTPITDEQRQSRRFRASDFAGAIDIVRRLGCQRAYVYAMALEPWLYYLMSLRYSDESRPIVESDRFVDECRHRGLQSERLYWTKEIIIE